MNERKYALRTNKNADRLPRTIDAFLEKKMHEQTQYGIS
jgi:hypothetical protein